MIPTCPYNPDFGTEIASQAEAQLNECELPPRSNRGTLMDAALRYCKTDVGQPWCAAFVCYMIAKAQSRLGLIDAYHTPRSASSTEIFNHLQAVGGLISYGDVRRGDIGFLPDLKRKGAMRHTFIVVRTKVEGGNEAGARTVEGNLGDCVQTYTRGSFGILYARPYWVPREAEEHEEQP